jgi:hypothetical protein
MLAHFLCDLKKLSVLSSVVFFIAQLSPGVVSSQVCAHSW